MTTRPMRNPLVSFHLLEDGTSVFEFMGTDGQRHEYTFDDPGYVMGTSVNFEQAAILAQQLRNGVPLHVVEAECRRILNALMPKNNNEGEQQ